MAYITVTVGNAAAVKAPAAATAKDALNQTVTVANDGAHYFNVAGKLAYTGTNKIDAAAYTSAREKAKPMWMQTQAWQFTAAKTICRRQTRWIL